MPDAVTLLKEDHRKVEDLFKQFEEAKGDGRKRKIAEQIAAELIVHTQIEEEIFYPACEGKVEDADIKEAYVEHDAAKVLVAEIIAGGPDDDYYESKVHVLQEEIEHHVKDEERWLTGVFSQAKRHGVDMDKLGDELAARKADLMGGIEKNGLPEIKLSTMEDVKV
ncbi:hemerythrin domain-containing protein [Sphingomonas sp. KRR8]|uniref:hemerythrin domain-containing protein n=1 Tax=Sphingomonas sp. KRR8 TaxID=2942996 RepID=UPI00202238AE|nr:hemerythrin domain-containing protein [Sphingomonas sp. KRR8]URD62267.1 hemerythrin domain-containing protein [Sphingomonas sp. KRR8]